MIGPFGKLLGAGRTRERLIRTLVQKRARYDPLASSLGNVDRIPAAVLMGLPEATIVTIVEAYWRMKVQDPYLSDKKIFEAIELQRSRFIDRAGMPAPLTLSSYVKYRVGLEHAYVASMMNAFLDQALEEADRVFNPGRV